MRALLRISKPSVSYIEEEALSLSVFSNTVSY